MDDVKLSNDAPIVDAEQDRLGFIELARHLANVFHRAHLSRGLVVGIEGDWGSGKSSLANLALRTMEEDKPENRPQIVRFSPWIVGNRDRLLQQLFVEFESAISKVLPNDRGKRVRIALRQYASLSPVIEIGSTAGALSAGIPPSALSKPFRMIGNLASKAATPSLSRLRHEIREQLRKLRKSIIVFVDDLDRLEPRETVEVLRLIRAVADFPNVAYLLAYDPSVLAKNLETALGVKHGNAYIEKIVQVSFRIPEPMRFDLRSWLEKEVATIAGHTNMPSEARERLERALSFGCSEYISTPRDVVRVANALKLYVAPLHERLDLADGLFLQIIRIHRPELHNWIERYLLRSFGSDPNDYYTGWTDAVEDSDGEHESELGEIIGRQGNRRLQFLHELRQHLPQVSMPDSQSPLAFGGEEQQRFAVEHRLYSPSYFRSYFALSMPEGFLGDEEVLAFLHMCSRDREAAVRHFQDRCAEDRRQGGNMAQVLLSRILERREDIPADQIPDLFAALGDSMDEFARRHPEPLGSPPYLYGDALEIFRLIRRLDTSRRMDTLNKLFANAGSLAWLNGIVRDAILERGFAGFSGEPKERRLLTDDEFEYIRCKFLQRLEQTDATNLKEVPYFLSLMYVWHWAEGGSQAKEWIRKQIYDGTELVDLLSLMLSKRSVSDGLGTREDYYLAKNTIEMFFESFEHIEENLENTQSSPCVSEEVRHKACQILASIERETGS